MIRFLRGLTLALTLLCTTSLVFAAPDVALSSLITYQGQLKVGGAPANGTYSFTFTCFNAASGGAQVGAGALVNGLTVSNGLITAPLDFGLTPANGQRVWLEIKVSADGTNFTTLTPRQEITAQFYALHALEAENALVAGPNSVNSASIVDSSVTGADIANLTITDADIAANTILGASIADGTIQAVDLANGAVTNAKLGASSVTAGKIAANAVTSQEVDPGTVQLRVTGTCAAGNAIQSITQTGGVTCQSTSSGASGWSLTGNAGTSAGSNFLGTSDGVPLVLRANNLRIAELRPSSGAASSSGASVVLGDAANSVGAFQAATVGGGGGRDSSGTLVPNEVFSFAGTVGGGQGNRVDASYGTISGGQGNRVGAASGAVGGGASNVADGSLSTVPGGFQNQAGGAGSFAAGERAHVRNATETGEAGSCGGGSTCGDEGTFIWADASTTNPFASTTPNQFLVRSAAGVAINTNRGIFNALPTLTAELTIRPAVTDDESNLQLLNDVGDAYRGFELSSVNAGTFLLRGIYAGAGGEPTNATLMRANYFGGSVYAKFAFNSESDPISGAVLQVGTSGNTSNGNGAYLTQGGTWTNGSSRTFKQAFVAVDPGSILRKVVSLPLSSWNYIDSVEGRHLGPMAEDFAAAFGLGNDDKHIATVDADGVALAAIQGLNEKLEQENNLLRAANQALDRRLRRLEALLTADPER